MIYKQARRSQVLDPYMRDPGALSPRFARGSTSCTGEFGEYCEYCEGVA